MMELWILGVLFRMELSFLAWCKRETQDERSVLLSDCITEAAGVSDAHQKAALPGQSAAGGKLRACCCAQKDPGQQWDQLETQ